MDAKGCSCKIETNGKEASSPSISNDGRIKPTTTISSLQDCNDFRKELNAMKNRLTYVTHQIHRVLLALHVPHCSCDSCSPIHQQQNEMLLKSSKLIMNGTTDGMVNSSLTGPSVYATPKASHRSVNDEEDDVAPPRLDIDSTFLLGNPFEGATGDSDDQSTPPPSLLNKVALSMALNGSAATSAHLSGIEARKCTGNGYQQDGQSALMRAMMEQRRRGRPKGATNQKSRYCTLESKRMIADFASNYGCTVAARKFGISPSIANYYYRKFYNQPLKRGRPSNRDTNALLFRDSTPAIAVDGDRDAEGNEVEDDGNNANGQGTYCLDGANEEGMLDNDADSPVSGDEAFCDELSSSAGLLKTRGRKKLIGDDLDQELFDYLLSQRRQGTKYNPESVLNTATEFVKSRRPGLLAADGGSIVLRWGWANKMMMRVNREYKSAIGSDLPAHQPTIPL